MSNLIERAKTFCYPGGRQQGDYIYPVAFIADFAQSERTRIADELEALSQKTPLDAMVTALLEYADQLRKND